MRYLKIGAAALAALVLVGLIAVIAQDRLSQPPAPSPREPDCSGGALPCPHSARPFRRAAHQRPHRSGRGFRIGLRPFRGRFRHHPGRGADLRAANWQASRAPKGAVTDYLVRLLKVRETVASQYDTALPADARAVLQAYADGVNYYAALHPEKVERGPVADDRPGRRRRIRVSHALLLWPRSCVREDHGARAKGEPGCHDRSLPVDRLQRHRRGGLEVGGRRDAPAGQFAPALCGSRGLVRGGARFRRRAGTWPAASSPARPSCCTATTLI